MLASRGLLLGCHVLLLGELCSCKSLRCHLPLTHVGVPIVDLLLILLHPLEPSGVLRLLHNDLDACAGPVQLVVNRVDEFLGSVHRH